jgi:hypothetical protein
MRDCWRCNSMLVFSKTGNGLLLLNQHLQE